MALCPMYLAAYVNGIYYYYCLDCDHSSTPVGAQDTRTHIRGESCDKILDPMFRITPSDQYKIQEGSLTSVVTTRGPVELEVRNSIDSTSGRFARGITFDNTKIDVLLERGVVLDHHETKKFKSTFQLNGTRKFVRLFRFHFSHMTGTGSTTNFSMRVGQELETDEIFKGSDKIEIDANDITASGSPSFVKITLKSTPAGDTGTDYYVLLK